MINEKQVKKYCCEDISKIENYDKAIADETQIWDCHHKLEIQGQFKNSLKLLKKCKVYYAVPASQLIFLTHSEHMSLHNAGNHHRTFEGRHHSEEAKKKISESHKGIKLSEEHKAKLRKPKSLEARKHLSEACKGRTFSEETRKKLSEKLKGRFFSEDTRQKISESVRGRKMSEDARKKISEKIKKRNVKCYWFNNGQKEIFAKECPPGFVKGRLKKI